MTISAATVAPGDRIAAIAKRLIEARKGGRRISLADGPRDFEEAFAIQEKVVAGLASPVIGWKVIELPDKRVIHAPLLASGVVPAGGTWKLVGSEPAGIELEIAFKLSKDVPAGASREALLDCIGSAHVVYELCQSRLSLPETQPRHVMLADCIANAGVVIGPAIDNWRRRELKAVPGRLMVDGRQHVEGKSVDPIRALELLAAALPAQGKRLRAGELVITGSLIGMNWLTGKRGLKGIIEGMGEVALTLEAA